MPIERIHQLPPLPARPKDAHKGNFGRVVVIGGSDSMLGAPVLAATAALRIDALARERTNSSPAMASTAICSALVIAAQ